MGKGKAPFCKRCGNPCQLYGGIGGYSVQCKECNERDCVRRRAGYALRKAAKQDLGS